MSILSDLTQRESTILALVAQGKRNAKIAQELYLSVRTVESHLSSIFKKFNFSSRTEAAIYAFQNGLLAKPEYGETTDYREGEKPL